MILEPLISPNISSSMFLANSTSFLLDNRNFANISWEENRNGQTGICFKFWDGFKWSNYGDTTLVDKSYGLIMHSNRAFDLLDGWRPLIAYGRLEEDYKLCIAKIFDGKWIKKEFSINKSIKWVGLHIIKRDNEEYSSTSSSSSIDSSSSSSSRNISSSSSVDSSSSSSSRGTSSSSSLDSSSSSSSKGTSSSSSGDSSSSSSSRGTSSSSSVDSSSSSSSKGTSSSSSKGTSSSSSLDSSSSSSSRGTSSSSSKNYSSSSSSSKDYSSSSSSKDYSSSSSSKDSSSSSSLDSSSSSSSKGTSSSSSKGISSSSQSLSSFSTESFSSSSSSIDSSSTSSSSSFMDINICILVVDNDNNLNIYSCDNDIENITFISSKYIGSFDDIKTYVCGSKLGFIFKYQNSLKYNFFDIFNNQWSFNNFANISQVSNCISFDACGSNSENDGKLIISWVENSGLKLIVVDSNSQINNLHLIQNFTIENFESDFSSSKFKNNIHGNVSISFDENSQNCFVTLLGSQNITYQITNFNLQRFYIDIIGEPLQFNPKNIIATYDNFFGKLHVSFISNYNIYYFNGLLNNDRINFVFPELNVLNSQRYKYGIYHPDENVLEFMELPCSVHNRTGDILLESEKRVVVLADEDEDPICGSTSSVSTEYSDILDTSMETKDDDICNLQIIEAQGKSFYKEYILSSLALGDCELCYWFKTYGIRDRLKITFYDQFGIASQRIDTGCIATANQWKRGCATILQGTKKIVVQVIAACNVSGNLAQATDWILRTECICASSGSSDSTPEFTSVSSASISSVSVSQSSDPLSSIPSSSSSSKDSSSSSLSISSDSSNTVSSYSSGSSSEGYSESSSDAYSASSDSSSQGYTFSSSLSSDSSSEGYSESSSQGYTFTSSESSSEGKSSSMGYSESSSVGYSETSQSSSSYPLSFMFM